MRSAFIADFGTDLLSQPQPFPSRDVAVIGNRFLETVVTNLKFDLSYGRPVERLVVGTGRTAWSCKHGHGQAGDRQAGRKRRESDVCHSRSWASSLSRNELNYLDCEQPDTYTSHSWML